MKITQNLNGTALTLYLEGRLDTTTAPELDSTAQTALIGITDLTIDMKDLEYISSAGLRVLLSMSKTMSKQGTMLLRNVNDIVREVLDMTGFADILNIQ